MGQRVGPVACRRAFIHMGERATPATMGTIITLQPVTQGGGGHLLQV